MRLRFARCDTNNGLMFYGPWDDDDDNAGLAARYWLTHDYKGPYVIFSLTPFPGGTNE